MHRTFKHVITSISLLLATQLSVACADEVKPVIESSNGTVLSPPPSSASQLTLDDPAIASIYGPSGEDETLWSIAKAYRPEKSVSVAQTVLAIYKLNPKAFEDHNIHGLISGSVLRLPTLEAIGQESTQEAVKIIQDDKLRPIPSEVDKTISPKPATLSDYLPTQSVSSPSDNIDALHEKSTNEEAPEEPTQPEQPISVDEPNQVIKQKRIETNVESSEQSQVEVMNDRLTLELNKIQQQLNELKTSLKADEQHRSQMNEVEAKSTSIDTPQAFVKIANQHPWLWVIILLPVVLMIFIIRLLFTRKVKRSDELDRLVAPEKETNPTMLVADSASAQTPPPSEPKPLHFTDDELPQYGEAEAQHDIEAEPQIFETEGAHTGTVEKNIDEGKTTDEESRINVNEPHLDTINTTDIPPIDASEEDSVDPLTLTPHSVLKGSDRQEEIDDPDLEVGLDEFPDVLGDVNDFDVDLNAEMNSNLDLAKAFLEMGDERTAAKLLKTVISKGDDALQAEANKLLSTI